MGRGHEITKDSPDQEQTLMEVRMLMQMQMQMHKHSD